MSFTNTFAIYYISRASGIDLKVIGDSKDWHITRSNMKTKQARC